jgi:hypothetical protein
VYETSSDEDTRSSGSGGGLTLFELVEFHIDIAQIDINEHMEGLIFKFNKYVDKRMKQLCKVVCNELDKESTSGN